MAFLWTKAQDGKKVKFDTPYNAQVFGKFDELIWKDAGVIYAGIDKLKARKRLEMGDSYLINFATNSKGKHFVIVSPYGLRGGSSRIIEEMEMEFVHATQVQMEKMDEISNSIESLKKGAKNQNIRDVVYYIKFLEKIECNDFLSPLDISLTIFCLLQNNWIWGRSYLREIRRKITKLARKLLLWAYHNKQGNMIMPENTKSNLLKIAELIETLITKKEKTYPETGLLCDIKEIKSVINCISTGSKWYQTLLKDGIHLLNVIFNHDINSLFILIGDSLSFLSEFMRSRPSLNSLIIDFLRKESYENEHALDKIMDFLDLTKNEDWELKHTLLDSIEIIMLDKHANLDTRLRCWNKFISILSETQQPNSNYKKYVWRIREKIASGIIKISICDNETLKNNAIEIITQHKDTDKDSRIKYIWRNPMLFQQALSIFEKDWHPSKTHYDKLIEEIEKNHQKNAIMLQDFGNRFDNLEDKISRIESSQNKQIFMVGINALFIGALNNISNIIQKENYQSRNDIVQDIWNKSNQNIINRAAVQIAIIGERRNRKKQVAIEFMKTYAHEFGVIWWINNASEAQSIKNAYIEIAKSSGVEIRSKWQDEVVEKIILLLGRQEKPWLLIFHNAENRDVVEYYMPKSQGIALITSRSENWDKVIRLAFDLSPQRSRASPARESWSSMRSIMSRGREQINSRSSNHRPASRNNSLIQDIEPNPDIHPVNQSMEQRRPISAVAPPNAKRFLVAIRIRHIEGASRSNIRAINNSIFIPRLARAEDEQYDFDRVFKNNEHFPDIFRHTVSSLIQPFLSENNVSAITCGREKSGKTYTMNGIIRLVFRAIFNDMDRQRYYLRISYIKIYTTGIIDLLSERLSGVGLEDNSMFRPTTIPVASEEEAMEKINSWKEKRPEIENSGNQKSLGHAVLKIELMETCSKSTFLLIDFAGSEANESLIALGKCLEAILSLQRHIPYSSSTITNLLRGFFDENCKNVMILNISSNDTNYGSVEKCLKLAENAMHLNLR